MKKLIGISIMILVLMCSCTTTQKNNGAKIEKKEEAPKLSDVQQKDVDIAKKLAKAADKMEKAKNFHIVATTQGGDVYDLNMSGTNYAGTETHMISVNGINQKTTDYVYEKDGKSATYLTFSGKILPASNNFGPYMISTMATEARSYKDLVPTEPQENYKTIFDVKNNKDGSMSIKTKTDKSCKYVLSKALYVIKFTDNFKQTFKADKFNKVTLDYSNSGF